MTVRSSGPCRVCVTHARCNLEPHGHDRPEQLDFDSRDLSSGAFEDGIDFGALLGPEVMQLDSFRAPAGLPPEFLDHPGLEQEAEQDTIPAERLDGTIERNSSRNPK